MYILRLATTKDLPAIWQLRLETKDVLKSRGIDQWQYNRPDYHSFVNDIEKKRLFVVTKDQMLCGMVAVVDAYEPDYDSIHQGKWLNDEPYLVVHRLAVSEKFQNQGIGKMLLQYADVIAKQKNSQNIRVDTHRFNQNAQNLFKACGYHFCGVITISVNKGDRARNAFHKTW